MANVPDVRIKKLKSVGKMTMKQSELFEVLKRSVSPDSFVIPKRKSFGFNPEAKASFLESVLKAYADAPEADEEIKFKVCTGRRYPSCFSLANDTRVIAITLNDLGIKPLGVAR